MSWKTVRLELAKTRDHPNGSPVRAYLLRLPLDPHGTIDVSEYDESPRQATVRRYWPNEPDRMGAIERDTGGWNFVFGGEEHGADATFRLDGAPILLGRHVHVIAPDSQSLPFKVLRCE